MLPHISFMRFSCLSLALLATSTHAQADCKADIQAIMKALESAGPYHVDSSAGAGDSASNMTADVILPHSLRMKGDGKEMVVTPNGVWITQGGTTQKMPDDSKDLMRGMIRQSLNIEMNAVTNAECPGSAEYEGGSYTLYKYHADAKYVFTSTKSKVDMYVNSNGRPEWMVIELETMGLKNQVRQHITFDDSITIADPQ